MNLVLLETKSLKSHAGGYHCGMLEQRIEQHFIDSADLKYQAAQVLSKPIAAAVQAILACVTGGGKVLAWNLAYDLDAAAAPPVRGAD